MPWYAHDIVLYRTDTQHLTTLEHGAYRLLLDEYYLTRMPLPADDRALANIARLTFDDWMKISATIRRFFRKRGNKLHQKRCDITLDAEDNRTQKRTEHAQKAANARHNKNKALRASGKSEQGGALHVQCPTVPDDATRPDQTGDVSERDSISVSTDTESLIVKSLPLAESVGKKINGFHNGINGSALKQQKADQFVQQRCAEALGNDGWMIVFAAEDENAPDHSRAVSLMLKTSKRLKLGWISPEEKRRRAQA